MFSYQSETPKLDFTYPLAGASVREMEAHTKWEPGQEQVHFNAISANYDDVMQTVGYPDPELIAETAKKIAEGKSLPRSEAVVADFGCGTGLVGEAMTKLGFTNIYGIDCSEGMLQIAGSKNVYKALTQHRLGGEDYVETFPTHLKNQFDFVTAGGLIEPNNYDEHVVQQMLFALKNGGHLIFSS